MICPKCGNRAEGNFCSHCGAALNPQVEKYMDDDFEFLTPEDFLKEEYINPVTEENLPESEIKLQLEPEIKPELKPELELKSEQEGASGRFPETAFERCRSQDWPAAPWLAGWRPSAVAGEPAPGAGRHSRFLVQKGPVLKPCEDWKNLAVCVA